MRNLRAHLLFAFGIGVVAIAAGVPLLGESRWSMGIFALLAAFTVVGDVLEVEARSLTISGAFLAIGLGMVMLGPVPAAMLGLIAGSADSIRRRQSWIYTVSNLPTFALVSL